MRILGLLALSWLGFAAGCVASVAALVGAGFMLALAPYTGEMTTGGFITVPKHIEVWLLVLLPVLLAGFWLSYVLAAWAPMRARKGWEEYRRPAKAWAFLAIAPTVLGYVGICAAPVAWDMEWVSDFILPGIALASFLAWTFHWARRAASMGST